MQSRFKWVLPLNLQSVSLCIYSLKRRNKHLLSLVIAIDVTYPLQLLCSSDVALAGSMVSCLLVRLHSGTLQQLPTASTWPWKGCSKYFPSALIVGISGCTVTTTSPRCIFFVLFLNQLPIFKIGF